MKNPFNSVTIILVSIFYINPSLALKGYDDAEKQIIDKRNDWLQGLKDEVITPPPFENSAAANKDRVISNEKMKIVGERKTLAEADRNQKHDYLSNSFSNLLFSSKSKYKIDLTTNKPFKKLQSLYNQGSYAKLDPKQPERAMEFILKDHFLRGRPKQVLDANGEYLPDYTKIIGSSYPSGHAWNAFKQAATLSMMFPEKIKEIYGRASEYGESRVIVGAHFPTDIIASRAAHFYLLAQHLADDKIAQSFATLAKDARSVLPSQCIHKPQSCFTPTKNDSANLSNNNHTVPELSPDKLPKLASNLLRLRFPYLNEEQRLSILASTAYSSDSLSGWNIKSDDPNTYWGVINLPDAFDGPTYFYNDFIVTHNKSEYSLSSYSTSDEWKKNIHGSGQLIKNGPGILKLSGNNRFASLQLNQGEITLSGENTYTKKSSINGGKLTVEGSLNSPLDIQESLVINNGKMHDVTINNNGLLIGTGKLRNLAVNAGGTISPGKNKAATIEIADSVTFAPNSQYLVEITENGVSDRLHSRIANLNGGTVNVTFQGSKNALTAEQLVQLLDKKYTILSAEVDIMGKFDTVLPGYTFVKSQLSYTLNDVTLRFSRSDIAFASFAETKNQKVVAEILDELPQNHTLYKSLILSDENNIKVAIHELSKPIHAHVLSSQINSTLPIRRTLLERIRNSESLNMTKERHENKGDLWVNTLYQQETIPNDDNTAGYHTSTNGIFLGASQRFYHDTITAGIAIGVTQSSLSSEDNTNKNINYHIAAYGGVQLKPIALRGGFEYNLGAIDTKRPVNYQMYADSNTSTYDINTSQAFVEMAYPLTTPIVNIEPFTNLAYINTRNRVIKENGGKTALSADEQSTTTLLSMLGLRLDNHWALNERYKLGLYGELGWQHQYGDLTREIKLKFPQTGHEFISQSVSAPRDNFTAKIGANVDINNDYKLSFDYNKLKSNHYDNDNINANFSVSF